MIRILILLSIFISISLGGVRAFVDRDHITLGDALILTIESDEGGAIFPAIDEIEGYKITSSGKSSNVSMINGKVTQTIAQRYQFMPTDSLVIPSFKVVTSKGEYTTNPIEVKVDKGQTVDDGFYSFEMIMDKSEVFIGEQVSLSLIFKRDVNAKTIDLQYNRPDFKDLWVKQVGGEENYRDGRFIIHKINYVLFPQKAGKIEIPSAIMRVGEPNRKSDMFGLMLQNVAKYKNIVSNKLEITAKPTPQDIKLVGDFEIEAIVDKQKTNANTPINLTIKISGSGNMDDIDDYELTLEDSAVYSNKPEKIYNVTDGRYGGEYRRDFAIIANKSFKIPPFYIKYYNPELGSVFTKRTEAIEIDIVGEKEDREDLKLQKLDIEDGSNEKIESYQYPLIKKVSLFLIGFILGGLSLFFAQKIRVGNNKEVELEIEKRIKGAKSNKELLKILLPLKEESREIGEIVDRIEESIYENGNFKISKGEIAKILKKNREKKDENCDIF